MPTTSAAKWTDYSTRKNTTEKCPFAFPSDVLIDLLSKEQRKSNQLGGKVHLFGGVFEGLPRQEEEGVRVDQQRYRIAEVHVVQPEVSHLGRQRGEEVSEGEVTC